MRTSDGTVRATAGQAPGTAPGAGAGSTLCWPGLVFARERVIDLGVPAQCWTMAGELWGFEDGSFFVTVAGDRGVRRRVEDGSLAPDGGWTHGSDCDCPACRVASA